MESNPLAHPTISIITVNKVQHSRRCSNRTDYKTSSRVRCSLCHERGSGSSWIWVVMGMGRLVWVCSLVRLMCWRMSKRMMKIG